jgi:site-specific DNA-methyltransferase (adenine-specific)
MRYPKNIIEVSNADRKNTTHPTQKPVALMEYLIKTYTHE